MEEQCGGPSGGAQLLVEPLILCVFPRQARAEELRVDASAGGGVVSVQMKGNHEIVSLKIDPEAVKEGDVEMLQDMVLAAINEANRKVDEAMKGKLGGMLPPGLGGLFG